MYYRNITDQILKDLSFFPVVAILGPRQVGKTTLSKWLMGQFKGPSLYLDLELDSDLRKLDDAETYLKSQSEKCVIIDEIQRLPTLFPLIRALVDMDRKPARFILLGSASPGLVKGASETLAGRIAYNELTPLSILEVYSEINIKNHWLKGGFPDALTAPKSELTFRWLGNFLQTFLFQDLHSLGYGINPVMARKLMEMLSYLHGNMLNMNDLSRSLGVSSPTVARYIDLMEGSFILYRLRPYHTNISKRLFKTPKTYFRDSGLLHYLSKIQSFDQLEAHPLIGASWEGYVIEQIKRNIGYDWQMYFYRSHVGAEVDLVLINPTEKKICIEIKLSNSPTVSKGFFECLKDIQPDYQFVIIPNGEGYLKSGGLKVCPLLDFLQIELPALS